MLCNDLSCSDNVASNFSFFEHDFFLFLNSSKKLSFDYVLILSGITAGKIAAGTAAAVLVMKASKSGILPPFLDFQYLSQVLGFVVKLCNFLSLSCIVVI